MFIRHGKILNYFWSSIAFLFHIQFCEVPCWILQRFSCYTPSVPRNPTTSWFRNLYVQIPCYIIKAVDLRLEASHLARGQQPWSKTSEVKLSQVCPTNITSQKVWSSFRSQADCPKCSTMWVSLNIHYMHWSLPRKSHGVSWCGKNPIMFQSSPLPGDGRWPTSKMRILG